MSTKRSIGIRVSPKKIFYTILEESEDSLEIITCSVLVVPIALIIPERLKFIRNTFLDILSEYHVNRASIRIMEPNAKSSNLERITIEAILQELLASSSVDSYQIGQISNITSTIGIDRGDFKLIVQGDKEFDLVEDWSSYNDLEKESILAALSAINLN